MDHRESQRRLDGMERRTRSMSRREQESGNEEAAGNWREDLSNEVIWKKQQMEGEAQGWLTERKRKV